MNKLIDRLKRVWVMIACLWLVISGCLQVSLRTLFGKATRESTNRSLYTSSIKILNAAKSTFKVRHGDNFKYLDNLPRVYLSNHLSLFDAPLFYATMPGTIRVVTKKELTKVPILGRAIMGAEQIIIDRKIPASSQNFYQDAREKLASGISLWIFSEGTRSRTGDLLPLKMGGFRLACAAGAQIIPVGIVGTQRILSAKKALPNLNQAIEIRVGDPIDTRGYTTPELLTELHEKVTNMMKKLCSEEPF